MAARAFGMELYREHLQEIANLYDLRLDWLCDWESTLEDVAGVEAQIEGHLQALEHGGEQALGVAIVEARPEDPWSIYGLVALACRVDRFAIVGGVLLEVEGFCEKTDTDERAAATLRQAVADALVHHLPDERAELVARALWEATPHVLAALATCVGARAWVQAADELRAAAGRDCADPAAMLRALAQVPGSTSSALPAGVGSEEHVVAQTAAVGALKRGDMGVLDRLAGMPRAPWAALPVAMSGGPAMSTWLVEAARGEEPGQALLALGVFGDPRGIDVLLEQLWEGAHAEAAAIGLYLLTGALLSTAVREEARLEVLEDRSGERAWASVHGSGISTDPVAWEGWLAANGERLRPGQRYRLGMLAGPHTDLAVLSTSLPLWLRRCLADEFVIRYGVQWGYEPDLLVVRQQEIVGWVRARLDDPRLRFIDGDWYFQGRLAAVGEWAGWLGTGRGAKE